ncbi:MAG: isoprenylcysteine carboxylmethyltransferase family protein [Vicinamibacterales bacterium]
MITTRGAPERTIADLYYLVITRFERLFAWTGGGLFAASLLVCVYAYLVSWGVPDRIGGGMKAGASNVALFLVFALHHSLFARRWTKVHMARVIPERLLRSLYVWIASLLLLIVVALWQPVGGDLYHVTGWRAAVHAGVQLAGLWLIARSVVLMDGLELAGIRPHAADEALHVEGPYRWVRHPLYLGWLLAVFGAAHMTMDRLIFAAVSATYLVVAVPMEERSLVGTFGEDYTRYARCVRWRLVPYIY